MHQFVDFKGFAEAELNLFKPLTVLIGPNGSGKTNAIEAIELLSFIAHGRQLHEISDVGRGGGLEIRGSLLSCPRFGKDSFRLRFGGTVGFDGKRNAFMYSVTIRVKPRPIIAHETLFFQDGTVIFETVSGGKSAASGDVVVRYNNFSKGGNKPKELVSANSSVLSQYTDFAKNNKKYDSCVGLIFNIMNYLKSSFVFDPSPKMIRGYERIGNKILQKDGSNLSAALYDLYNNSEDNGDKLNRLISWIKQVPEEPFDSVEFVTTKLNDVILAFKYGGPKPRLVDARLLSDGTLRCLAVLTALETAQEHSRVIIEEFDNGLHPTRVGVLAGAIRECCERRNINVLVTTHNPATLDALDEKQLSGVVTCSWDQSNKAFRLVELQNIPRHAELFERGRLGDLVTRRVIEQYLAADAEDERKKQLNAWLETL